ncbi:MAG TPA: hypothetical protein VL854_12500, partial [Nitrososphaeraceae archaeon]|nr:hypothetical protein [Nitrososphaeraceae archaeon]
MNSHKNTFHLFAEHITLALLPLSNSVSDLKSFKEFMFRLGWHVDSLPSSFTNLANSVNEAQMVLESLPENPDIDQIKSLFIKISEIYSGLRSITEVPDGVDTDAFRSEIGERIFEILLTDYLRSEFPIFYNALQILGIIDYQHHEATDTRPSFLRTRFRFEQIKSIVSNPHSIPQVVYGWGTQNLNFPLISNHLHELLQSLNFPISTERIDPILALGYDPSERSSRPIIQILKIPIFNMDIDEDPFEASVSLFELPEEEAKLPGLIIQPEIPSEIDQEHKVDDNLTIKVRAGTDLSSIFGFLLRPGEISFRNPFQPDSKLPDAGFGITLEYLNENSTVLFGSQEKSRLEMKGMAISLNANYNQEKSELILVVEAALKELALVIASKEQDSLLAKFLGGSDSRIPIPLIIGWSSKRGFYFSGNAGFSVSFNPHLKIGGAKIDKLTLQLLSGDRFDPNPNFATEILASISGSVGPVSFSMDGIGLQLKTI